MNPSPRSTCRAGFGTIPRPLTMVRKMVQITLPDGSVRSFDGPVTGTDVAADISKSLAKAALAVKVDGELKDVYLPIEQDARVEIITGEEPGRGGSAAPRCSPRARRSSQGTVSGYPGHHRSEHRKRLFLRLCPGGTVRSGRSRTDRSAYAGDRRARRAHPSRSLGAGRSGAPSSKSIGEHYKAEIIASIPAGEEVGLYRQGEFIDLCRGPHLPSTGKLGKAFKLMSIAGAYWRGDSNNEMLQRIYGTAWASENDLKDYLTRLEEAEKRDHRRLGREMDLFHLQEEGPGAVFWHPKGWSLFQSMISYMREKQRRAGYQEVNTPGDPQSLAVAAIGAR